MAKVQRRSYFVQARRKCPSTMFPSPRHSFTQLTGQDGAWYVLQSSPTRGGLPQRFCEKSAFFEANPRASTESNMICIRGLTISTPRASSRLKKHEVLLDTTKKTVLL